MGGGGSVEGWDGREICKNLYQNSFMHIKCNI